MRMDLRLDVRHARASTHRYAYTLPAWMLLTLLHLLPVSAFPPAPHHLFFGMVRDEYGNPLATDNAEVILETPSKATATTRVVPGLVAGENYRLAVPMDAGITQDLYQPTALQPTVPFKIKIKIGSVTYLPLEMAADFSKMGQPGQRTRLDLTLGEDSDGDGIPDAWERVLLSQLGKGASLAEIRPGDDSDGDGLSNLSEYLSGNYAFDAKDGFTLKAAGVSPKGALLEFTAIRGRTYTIHGSSDLTHWTQLEFRVPGEATEAPRQSYYATDVRPVRAEVNAGASVQFFKLMVE